MMWMSERLKAPSVPLLVWLVGLITFTVVSVESMFTESHAVFVFARMTAYITSLTMAALVVGLLALFGIGCGMMLWWLEDALSLRRIASALSISFWPAAVYMWLGTVLLLVDLPAALTLADVARPSPDSDAIWGGVLAFEWLQRLRYAVVGCFLLLAAATLARRVKLFNAILAVGFGAALVAAVIAVLSVLATALELE